MAITLAQLDLWANKDFYEPTVYRLPKKLDEEVARLHLELDYLCRSATGNFSELARQFLKGNYLTFMSYVTLAVEIDHGKVVAKEPSKLPEKASGLLTILQPESSESLPVTPLQALDALQKHLNLNPEKAEEWMATVRAARR